MLASQHLKSLTAPDSPDRGVLLVCLADNLASWPLHWTSTVPLRSARAVEQEASACWWPRLPPHEKGSLHDHPAHPDLLCHVRVAVWRRGDG